MFCIKKFNFFCVLVVFYSLNSLSSFSNDFDSLVYYKFRIDPQLAVAVKASDLYESVEYIPLQLPNTLKVGMISRMVVIGNRWVIYDLDSKTTFIFDDNGKYINSLAPKKVAAHAGLSISVPEGNIYNSFSIIEAKGKSFILIGSNKKFLYYDLDGNFVRADLIFESTPLLIFPDSTRLFRNFSEDNIQYATYALVGKSGSQKFHPYNLDKFANDEFYAQGSGFYPSRDKKTVLFVDYYSYKVEEISQNGVKEKYQFIFPNTHSLPSDFSENPIYKNKKWDYFIENKQAIYGIHNLVEVGDYLYFSLASYSKSASDKKNLALHIPSQKLYSLQHVIPDDSTYNLPTNDALYGNYFLGKGFYAYDSKYLYTIISPLSMSKFNEENKERTKVYPELLLKNIALGAKGNPVIVKINPKTK